MKILLLASVVAIATFASSCRTALPVDPMTGKRSVRCLPGHLIEEFHVIHQK